MNTKNRTILITGFSGLFSKQLLSRLRERNTNASFRFLIAASSQEASQSLLSHFDKTEFELLIGHTANIHLGLSGVEYSRLREEITDIWHLGESCPWSQSRDLAFHIHVDGTRNILELARESPNLQRLIYFSSAFVSGNRVGLVCEDELEMGQSFHSAYEESKYHAELRARRAIKDLPIIILRPSIMVGDSLTGELYRFNGIYQSIISLVKSPIALPMPGAGDAPLHLIPTDYCADAAIAISENQLSIGRTFHIADIAPLSVRGIWDETFKLLNRLGTNKKIPARAAGAFLGIPLLERHAKPHKAALPYINQMVFYNCQNTLELLQPLGIHCPPISIYLPKLIEHAKNRR